MFLFTFFISQLIEKENFRVILIREQRISMAIQRYLILHLQDMSCLVQGRTHGELLYHMIILLFFTSEYCLFVCFDDNSIEEIYAACFVDLYFAFVYQR